MHRRLHHLHPEVLFHYHQLPSTSKNSTHIRITNITHILYAPASHISIFKWNNVPFLRPCPFFSVLHFSPSPPPVVTFFVRTPQRCTKPCTNKVLLNVYYIPESEKSENIYRAAGCWLRPNTNRKYIKRINARTRSTWRTIHIIIFINLFGCGPFTNIKTEFIGIMRITRKSACVWKKQLTTKGTKGRNDRKSKLFDKETRESTYIDE